MKTSGITFTGTFLEYNDENVRKILDETPWTVKFERSWRKRLLSRPWRPWVRWDSFSGKGLTLLDSDDAEPTFSINLDSARPA